MPDDFDNLLARVRSGDDAAARDLYRRIQPRLARYLRSQEASVSEDLASDVWLAVARQLDEFQGGEEDFRSWVFTIARRRVLDHRRKGIRRRTGAVSPEVFEGRLDETSDPADISDAQAAVDRICSLLSPEQAEVIMLRVVADLDAAAVGRIMGRSANWVRVNQHRALRRLASELDLKWVNP